MGWTALALLLCAVVLAQVQRVRARTPDLPDLLGDLAREVDDVRSVGPRLSIASGYGPCTPGPSPEPGLPDMRCAAAPPWRPGRGALRVLRRAHDAVHRDADLDATHTAALADLIVDAGGGKSTGRSIQALWAVARRAEQPAAAWADLSAAYLLRAEQGGSPRDLLAAAEAAERALELAPANPSALYNRALALQRLGLADVAAWGWREYLAVDASSPWAAEARRRLAIAAGGPVSPAPPPPADAPLAAYADYARAEPQAARLLGQDSLLGAWGDAVLSGDTAGAVDALRRAGALGEALRRRPGGDGTLADMVDAIRAAGGGARARALARAHRAFAAGRARYDAIQYPEAGRHLDAAAAAAGASPALAAWTRLFQANLRIYAGDVRGGEALLAELAAETDTVRYPALAARLRWSLAGTRVRTDRYEVALETAEAAVRLFTRAGEREYAAVCLSALANAQFPLGETDRAYAGWTRVLWALRPYRASERLHAVLVALSTAAADDGFPRAAVRVQDEGVYVTRRRGEAVFTAEALLARARLLPALGRPGLARRDLDSARAALGPLADSLPWTGADLQVASGVASLFARSAGVEEAAAALDSAAAFFMGNGVPFRGFPALVSAAQARLAMRDLPGATTRLESAFALLEARRDSVRMEPRRAAVFDQARGVVDRVVMLHLAAGRAADALRFLDGARASLAPSSAGEAGTPDRPVEGPPGEVGLQYALVADTLLAWTVSGRAVSVARVAVDTVQLVHAVARLRQLLESGGDDGAIQALLERLHGWLMAPVQGRLGSPGTPVVVVADGVLAQVPFAALRGPRRGRYLVADHPLRFAVSLREAWRPRPPARGGRAVVVADPAFEPRAHPGLRRLRGAEEEAREVARAYGAPWLLSGPEATPDALREALAGAAVVHYAGHAVFDDERPERSHLVLAPLPGRPGSGRLTAGELAGMELPRAPLVVLAACRSVNGGGGRASGFTGLAGALLAAGAGGVVGGLWEVDDQRTRPLMIAFHHALRGGTDGARALRTAQLEMMKSADPALRSPAAWAGFRYVGR